MLLAFHPTHQLNPPEALKPHSTLSLSTCSASFTLSSSFPLRTLLLKPVAASSENSRCTAEMLFFQLRALLSHNEHPSLPNHDSPAVLSQH